MAIKEILILGGVTLSIFWILSVILFIGCLIKDMKENDNDQLM